MRISVNPKFIPLVQKPYCCCVTCLQMILYRRGFGLFDQEKLAKFFDVRVNKDSQKCFNVKLGLYTRENFDEGIKTISSAPLVNRFFRKHNIPLKATAVRASKIKDVKKFIEDHLLADDDLWVEYKAKRLLGYEGLHDNVVESIETTSGKTWVTMVDPYVRHKTRGRFLVEDVREAISKKFGRETGFLVISSR